MAGYKFQKWTRFFKERARYRTLCVECAEMIHDYHHKLRRKHRRQAQARGEDPTKWSPRGGPRVVGSRQSGLGASHGRSTLLSSQAPIQRPSSSALRALESATKTPMGPPTMLAGESPPREPPWIPTELPGKASPPQGPQQSESPPRRLTPAQLGPAHRRIVARWIKLARTSILTGEARTPEAGKGP